MMVGRRSFIHKLGATALLPYAARHAAARPGGRRPNIIFIMADDLGYADLSCTGSRHIRTPAIDSLARDGVRLTQGYSSTPICSPTRTALLTGCYAQRFPIGLEEPLTGRPGDPKGLPFETVTLPHVLRNQGYRTMLVGKWHLGAVPDHGPLKYGYDRFFGIVEGAADYHTHRLVIDGRQIGSGLVRDEKPTTRPGYLTNLFGEEAVRFVEAPDDTPFFLSLHFTAPHWPWEGEEDQALAKSLMDSRHGGGGNLDVYRRMVETMDANIARLLDALNRTGKAKDTLVVFTSDNGGERFSETWPFAGQKGEVLEGGVRVPILGRWPAAIGPGIVSPQVMASMDFLPTLLAIAGGRAPKAGTFDGRDLSAQLLGRSAPVERPLYWRFKANDQAALRLGDYKYVRLAGREYLFNLEEDARERADLSRADPRRLATMRRHWDEWNARMLPYPPTSYSEDVKTAYPDRY